MSPLEECLHDVALVGGSARISCRRCSKNPSTGRSKTLRGVGGLVFIAHGNRFANKLRMQDYVTGDVWKNKPPFHLSFGSTNIALDVESRNSVSLVQHPAADMGVPVSKMEESIEALIQTSLKSAQDHVGGTQRILAASLGTKLPARWAQGRSPSTTPFREPISQHNLHCRSYHSRDPLLHGWIGN